MGRQLIQTYLPNVYKLGWSGRWMGTIFMTALHDRYFLHYCWILGLVTGLLLVLTRQECHQ